MRNGVTFEGLESRKLFSAVALAASAVKVIGPTGGSYAASVQRTFASLNANDVDPSVDTTTHAALDSSLKITVNDSPAGGINASHLVRQAIQITNMTTGVVYNKNGVGDQNITALLQKVKTSGGGDILVLSPNGLWDASTTYRVEVNGSYATGGTNGDKVTDVSGNAFDDFVSSFTTGPTGNVAMPTVSAAFNAVTQNNAGTHPFTAVAIGPDHRLYAATTDGYIYRYTIGSDGTLAANPDVITTVRDNNGGGRIITGIAFDPGSTSTNLVLWVSHGQYRFGNDPGGSVDVQKYADNFTGKISTVSGSNLQNYQDIIVNIPRSVKDHMNNQLVFSPDKKALYFGVAAMNAMGQADVTWGNRVENIYSATIMQLRLGSAPNGINTYIHAYGAVNLKIDGDQDTATGLVAGTTHYNIFKGSNPLRIWADGIRNDFDLVFAANGHLYAGINGSSAGGNTPATPTNLADVPVQNRLDKGSGTPRPYTGPTSAGLTNVQTIEEDTLLDVKNGAYYGHPNATRGEYILDGGNPTSGIDPYEFAGNGSASSTGYAVGQQPDRNYTLPAYDFGQDFSPDGLIEYQSVGGKNKDLDGYILVARYSSGSDIVALKPNANGSVGNLQVRIPGLTGLNSPLDMVEDPTTGKIYVAELTSEVTTGALVMLTPTDTTGGTTGGTPSLNKSKLGFYVTPGSSAGATQTVTLTNTGSGSITVDRSATKVSGTYRKNFGITNLPADDLVLNAGQSYTFNVKGVLATGQTTTPHTTLAIRVLNTSGGDVYSTVNLRAFDQATVSTQSFTPQSLKTTKSSLSSAGTTTASESVIDQLEKDDSLLV